MIRGILHDPVAYPEPFKFNPDRFYPAPGKDGLNPDPRQYNFGFGRRICPGRYFAMDATWSVIVNVLAAFDVLPPINPTTGKEEMPVPDWTGGAASFPKPYQCRFVWRSEDKKKLVALRHDDVNSA